MRYDESYTFLRFVSRDIGDVFNYPLPNNHVLHSILAKAATFIWGNHPASIRLIAFGSGIALIPLVYVLCRALGQSGVLASIMLAVFPFLVLYSTNARGYTLLVLLTLCLALIGSAIPKQPSLQKTALFSLTGALGMLTMPSMLFPIAGIYVWVLVLFIVQGDARSGAMRKFAVMGVLMTGALTALFYIPVVLASNGIHELTANRFVSAQPWQEFSGQLFPHFRETWTGFMRDIPGGLQALAAMLFAAGIFAAVREQRWHSLLLLLSMLSTSGVLLLAKQRIPFDRTWICLIPFFVLVADGGFAYVARKLSPSMQTLAKMALVTIAALLSVHLMTQNTVSAYPDTGTFAEAEVVAKYLEPVMGRDDRIKVLDPADWPLYFYLWYHHVPRIKTDSKKELKEYFVVKKGAYSIRDMTDKPCVLLLELGDLALYQSS